MEEAKNKKNLKTVLNTEVPTPNFKKIKRFFVKFFKVLPTIIYLTASLSIIAIVGSFVFDYFFDDYDYDYMYEEYEEELDPNCNVLGLKLNGVVTTYLEEDDPVDTKTSFDIVEMIKGVEENENITAIVLGIDSYGGYLVAGEEIASALKKTKKPSVAIIRRTGASAAYLAASGADKIFASKNSDLGGIGITMSYLDYSKQNKKDGIEYISLSSGKFKDSGDPDKELSAEEKDLFMRDVKISHKNFIDLVAENRNLPVEKVESLADGSTMMGQMALENGLIDYIGSFPELEDYLFELIGSKPQICWR